MGSTNSANNTMNGYGSRFQGEMPPKRGAADQNFHYSTILRSLFNKLPGDVERFHELHVKLIDCAYDRTIPFFGRAYLGSDNNIYMCGNATWKMFLQNDRRAIQNLVLHEMIHLYDRRVREFDFRRPDDLACSEVRAYAMSSQCNGSPLCIF